MSLQQVLARSHKFSETGTLMSVSREGEDEAKIVLISNRKFTYNGHESNMMNLRDLTQHY